MLKPLSIWRYYQLNRRKVNIVFAITFLSIFLQCVLLIFATSAMRLNLETPLEFMRTVTFVELIEPTTEERNRLIQLLNKQLAVAKVIPFEINDITISGIGSAYFLFFKSAEIKPMMQTLHLNLIRGRLPRPGSREAVLHWRVAANKGLKIGDHFNGKISEDNLSTEEYQLTGVLDGKTMIGFADLDKYYQDCQLAEEKSPLLILPQPGQLAQVKLSLKLLKEKMPILATTSGTEGLMKIFINNILLLVNIIYLLVTGIVTICAGFLFYLYFYQRRSDFGLLEALGHTRSMVIGRAFREILVLNLLAFGSALAVSIIGAWAINRSILQARGLALVIWDTDYLIKLLSTPLFVACCSLIPVWRMLKKVDPVSTVERAGQFSISKAATNKPVSAWNYFRNNQRSVGTVFTVTLLSIVLQVALLIYVTSTIQLYQRLELEPWKALTYIYQIGGSREKLSHIRSILDEHRFIDKIIPFSSFELTIKGVPLSIPHIINMDSSDILPVMQALDLKLIKGRLPVADSYEVALHWQLAANRRMQIGDCFGPFSKFRVVGLLDGKTILGFSTLEYVTNDFRYSKNNLPLLVIPKKDRLDEVKYYLAYLAQKNTTLYTSTRDEKSSQEYLGYIVALSIVVYLTITIIITLCVGFLFYLYFYQRRSEFGLLEALGHTRRMILCRVFQEIFRINLLGFGLGLIVTCLGGWVLNRMVFINCGLPLVLWESSYFWKLLPIPLLITICTIIPVWRMLAKTDPILMIEGER
jgi:ABC-type antimicrobial peptide transport system permease subunit